MHSMQSLNNEFISEMIEQPFKMNDIVLFKNFVIKFLNALGMSERNRIN